MTEQDSIVCVNGEYLPRSTARIDPFDFGWRRGWVVYDSAPVLKGYVFKLDTHIKRLWNSMLAAKITPPFTQTEAKEILIETVRRNGLQDATTWIYVSYGILSASGYFGVPTVPTYLVIAVPYLQFGGQEAQEKGIKAFIPSVRAIPPQCIPPQLKHINRLPYNLADMEAQAAGAQAPIVLDIHGYVTENNAANVWMVKDGGLYTPSADGILQGITRETIFEIAQEQGILASEKKLTPYDLYTADEIFFSSSSGGIIPVVGISDRIISIGQPGEMTKRISKLYFTIHDSKKYGTAVYS